MLRGKMEDENNIRGNSPYRLRLRRQMEIGSFSVNKVFHDAAPTPMGSVLALAQRAPSSTRSRSLFPPTALVFRSAATGPLIPAQTVVLTSNGAAPAELDCKA